MKELKYFTSERIYALRFDRPLELLPYYFLLRAVFKHFMPLRYLLQLLQGYFDSCHHLVYHPNSILSRLT